MNFRRIGKALMVSVVLAFALHFSNAPMKAQEQEYFPELEPYMNVLYAAEEMAANPDMLALFWNGPEGNERAFRQIIQIYQNHQVEGSYDFSVEETDVVVRNAWDDREIRDRTRYGGVAFRREFGNPTFVPAQIHGRLQCAEAQLKAAQARRLAEALTRIAQLNTAAAGIVGGIMYQRGGGWAARFAIPLGFAATTTGMAAGWANQLANSYTNAPCDTTGGSSWTGRTFIKA